MLEVRGLCKSYGGRRVLEPVRFVLPQGQCLGLAGHNGSGKSTLLRLMAQIERADSGQLLYEGKSVLGDRRFLRTALGYVPQSPQLAGELTVRRQLQLWQGACGLSGPLPEEVVELLDLEELMPRRISDLSGGMAQRVSVGLALLSRPRLLLMDEATTGLDRGYVPRLLDWLEDFVAGGGGLVWCSHHAGELDRLCGAVLTLENGALRT